MNTARYKGFAIASLPYQLLATEQWTIDLEISRRGRRRAFSSRGHRPTEAEARTACLELGRRIIDGLVPGCSVAAIR